MNLTQLLTDQRAYEEITHSRWGALWNWRWRRVGDDEERRSPSLEPQTDSRSVLPRKNRAWWRLRLVDRDNSFSLIFFLEICEFIVSGGSSAGPPGGYNPPGRARRGGSPGGLCPPRCRSPAGLGSRNSYIDINNPHKVSFHSENFYFCTKTTPW